jgi:hypothetical protein
MMNVSIKTDQYGIQLCTDKEGVDNTLELHDVGEIRRIQSACEDFIRADKTGMSELKISFSHNYPKLHGQTFARLVAIEIHEREEMLDRFIQYDTKYLAVLRSSIHYHRENIWFYYFGATTGYHLPQSDHGRSRRRYIINQTLVKRLKSISRINHE